MFQKRCCWFIFWAGCFHGGGAVLLLHPSSSSRWGNLSAWWAKSRWNPGEARVLWMIQGFAIRSPVLYAFIFLCVLFMCFLVQMIGLASVVESPAWLLAHRLFSSDASLCCMTCVLIVEWWPRLNGFFTHSGGRRKQGKLWSGWGAPAKSDNKI